MHYSNIGCTFAFEMREIPHTDKADSLNIKQKHKVMKAYGMMMPRTHKHYIKKIRGWFYVFECDDLSGDAFFETKEEAEKYIAEIEEAWQKKLGITCKK